MSHTSLLTEFRRVFIGIMVQFQVHKLRSWIALSAMFFLTLIYQNCSPIADGMNDLAADLTSGGRIDNQGDSGNEDSAAGENSGEDQEELDAGGTVVRSDIRPFIFGHSLIVHENTPNPSEEKKVPHWLFLLAQAASKNFTADGQYGFLTQHRNFANISPQWGFQAVPSVWQNELTPFADVDFNLIMMTPANFIQYQDPDQPYFDSPSITPISATLDIFDQSRDAHPNIPFYIYENWPDMAAFGTFPDGIDFAAYNASTRNGAFHSWFIGYHDALLEARPSGNIKMIPVGPILSGLFTETDLSMVPLTSLYEDDAPHGQPTLYFLASLVTYAAIFGEPPPANFTIPTTVHPLVRNNYAVVRSYIWRELQNFDRPNGDSRVF